VLCGIDVDALEGFQVLLERGGLALCAQGVVGEQLHDPWHVG
jgi:hypothetical protein